MALQSVKSENLRRITIHPFDIYIDQIGDTGRRQWHDLDRLLVQFWTSHSIRPTIVYEAMERRRDFGAIALSLLPELVGRGLVDLYDPTLFSKGKGFDRSM
jgi:hypothetical protein